MNISSLKKFCKNNKVFGGNSIVIDVASYRLLRIEDILFEINKRGRAKVTKSV